MDLDKEDGLEDTDSESDDPNKAWKVLTKMNEQDRQNLKKAENERIARGLRPRQNTDLESLRAAKRQKREERKEEIGREQEARDEAAEVRRREIATERARMPKYKRDIEECLDILPQTWKKGVKKNVIERVRKEMNTMWPVTDRTEFIDKEVKQMFKIRYTPENKQKKVPFDQFHALVITTEPGEEEGTTVKKTVLLKRLSRIWIRHRSMQNF